MDIQIYYQLPHTKVFQPVNKELLPLILNTAGVASTVLLFKNVSGKVLSNITLTPHGVPIAANLTSALTDVNTIPAVTDFNAGLTYSYATVPIFKSLEADESFKLTIQTNYSTNVGIDFADFSLDLTYTVSLIDLMNLIFLYDFTENAGSTILNQGTGQASSTSIIRGNGVGYFSATDTVTTIFTPSSSCSLFVKGIFDNSNTDQTFFTVDNLAVGINVQRQPFVKINNTVIRAQRSLVDFDQSYVLGFSITDTKNILFTVDGIASAVLDMPNVAEPLNIVSTTGVIGNFNGELEAFVAYKTFQYLPFHTTFALAIK